MILCQILRKLSRLAALTALVLLTPIHLAAQEMRGHGGPVRALGISPDGTLAMSGSFDQSSILWQMESGAALAVLRFHQGAVNAVAALADGSFATGGEDGRIAIWAGDPPSAGLATGAAPSRTIEGHKGGISALAVSRDGTLMASASWDETARIITLATGQPRVLTGHKGPLSGVAFTPHNHIVTTGHDGTLRIWGEDDTLHILQLDVPQSSVVVAPDGEIIMAGADGRLRFVSAAGKLSGEIEIAPVPLVALALSRDGSTLAAGGLRGQTVLVDRLSRRIRATLVGPGLPVWSLAFAANGAQLYSGGADRLVRRWNAITGEHIGQLVPRAEPLPMVQQGPSALHQERGAELFRACAACHTLALGDGNRAGPSLHGIMGRRIATQPGYAYSPALKAMEIVWTKDTIARLFEIGPTAYTPGTKMPEQVITSVTDREALVEWLERATR